MLARVRRRPRVLLVGVFALALAGGNARGGRERAASGGRWGARLGIAWSLPRDRRRPSRRRIRLRRGAYPTRAWVEGKRSVTRACGGVRDLSRPSERGAPPGGAPRCGSTASVLAHQANLALTPASNEKIFTAMGALALLGADARLTTEVRLTPRG
jgi:D-Ala-D-Ala carboxypeptidase 3 (S13) family